MLEKPQKVTKTSKIFEALYQDILSHRFSPGERLPMSMLKTHYQVSGSALREALSRLAAQGLVEEKAQCGCRVASLSLEELQDIYLTRSIIGVAALEIAMQRNDDVWEAELVASLHRLTKYINPDAKSLKIEINKWEKCQRNFFTTIVKGCQSIWLVKIHDLLYDQAIRYRRLCLNKHHNNKKVLRAVIEENQQLVDAILAKNTVKACEILRSIWGNTIQIITEILLEQSAVSK